MTEGTVFIQEGIVRSCSQTEVSENDSAGALLIADADNPSRLQCVEAAAHTGLPVLDVRSTEQALETLNQVRVGIVIADLEIPRLGGKELLRLIRERFPGTSVIVLAHMWTVSSVVETMQLGAADCLARPFSVDELRKRLTDLASKHELERQSRLIATRGRANTGFGPLVGTTPKMQSLFRLIGRVSQHNYPVLLLGETGTGKELVARSIHCLGPRREKPFVPVDCSTLVPTLIESELFGYLKGAFTGANMSRDGLFQAGKGGTLFLDEIGDLSLDLQGRLLRAIQEKEVRPIGSTHYIPVDVRIIAATNKDLETSLRQRTFRQDLYFRINVVPIELPPLRERKTDIPLLVDYFLEKFGNCYTSRRAASAEAMEHLISYDWPGNVRELENAIESAVALGSGPILEVADLPHHIQFYNSHRVHGDSHADSQEEIERCAILRTLRECGGAQSEGCTVARNWKNHALPKDRTV